MVGLLQTVASNTSLVPALPVTALPTSNQPAGAALLPRFSDALTSAQMGSDELQNAPAQTTPPLASLQKTLALWSLMNSPQPANAGSPAPTAQDEVSLDDASLKDASPDVAAPSERAPDAPLSIPAPINLSIDQVSTKNISTNPASTSGVPNSVVTNPKTPVDSPQTDETGAADTRLARSAAATLASYPRSPAASVRPYKTGNEMVGTVPGLPSQPFRASAPVVGNDQYSDDSANLTAAPDAAPVNNRPIVPVQTDAAATQPEVGAEISREITQANKAETNPMAQPANQPQAEQPASVTSTPRAASESEDSQPITSPAPLENSKPPEKAKQRKEVARRDGSSANIPAGTTLFKPGLLAPTSISAVATAENPASKTASSNPALVAAPSDGNSPALLSDGPNAKHFDTDAHANNALAFAVKVQGSAPVTGPSKPKQIHSGVDDSNEAARADQSTAPAAAAVSGEKNSPLTSKSKDDGGTGAPAIPAAGPQVEASSSNDKSASRPDEASAVMPAQPEDQVSEKQSVKAIQVQITGVGDQRVDLRMMERAGSLTMSVRSADGSLTKALQQQLPELASRMNEQQISAEWWKPESLKIESPASSGSSSDAGRNNNNSAGQEQGGRGNSGQQGERGARQTDWLEELSDLRKSTQNGAQYSWPL